MWKTFLSYILIINNVSGYKILVICPPPAKSINILCKVAVDALIDRGHEVTFVSAFPSKAPKYREIVISELQEREDSMNVGFQLIKLPKSRLIELYVEWTKDIARLVFNNTDVEKIMNNRSENMDAVIFPYLMNEYLLGFGVKFNCPTIILSPTSLMNWLATMTRNPLSIATVPNISTEFSAKMTLMERVLNTIIAGLQELIGWYMMDPLQESLYKKYFPVESHKVPYIELKNKISAVLINSHPSAGIARPLLPNAVEIGGYHIEDPTPLPADLQKIMDSSKNGVIFFSMGCYMKSSEMDVETRTIILNRLSKLNETILWKYEEDLPNKPSNVIIRNWMPQTSILAHPNTKLFISQGGLLSVIESTHFGVPLLILPIVGDQHHNAKSVSIRGNGVALSFDNITESTIGSAIKEALSPKYRIKAKILQDRFRDRPIKPKDLLVYQVEHVLRTNGGNHLSPPKISRYSNLLLDVAVIIISPILIINFSFIYIIYKCCCKKSKKNQSNIKSVKTKKNK